MKYFIFGGNGFVGRSWRMPCWREMKRWLYVTYTQPLMNELQRVALVDKLIFVIRTIIYYTHFVDGINYQSCC